MFFKKESVKMMTSIAVLGAVLGCGLDCSKETTKEKRNAPAAVQMKSVELPSGAGVLLKDKEVVLIPNEFENKFKYEHRLAVMKESYGQTGYRFVSILTQEHKAAYDCFMFDFRARQGKMYDMMRDPVSSWASMQMAVGAPQAIYKYTPNDIRKAFQQETNLVQKKAMEKGLEK